MNAQANVNLYTEYSALGAVCALMVQSQFHRKFLISDLAWMIHPPLKLGQLKLFIRDEKAIGYATWAYLSDEAVGRLLAMPSPRLSSEDWKSGSQPWVIDLVASAGDLPQIKRQLKEEVFASERVQTFVLHKEADGTSKIAAGEFV